MAQVDFSNAVLTPLNDGGQMPLSYGYLNLDLPFFYSTSSSSRVNNDSGSASIISETYNKITRAYSGTFTASGTEFRIGDAYRKLWKVSNISFSSGDTYSFAIEVEVSGNA